MFIVAALYVAILLLLLLYLTLKPAARGSECPEA
jgi:hypothetical protein